MNSGDRQDPLFGGKGKSTRGSAKSDSDQTGPDQHQILEHEETPPRAGPGQMTLDPAFDYRSRRRTRGTRTSRPSPRRVYNSLDLEQRLAAIAAIGMVAALILPWWQEPGERGSTSPGFLHLSFIELAIVVISLSVLLLLYRRGEERVFHLPLSDGTLAAAAGVWCCFLLIYRMFDAPLATVGATRQELDPHWGIVCAFAFAVLLLGSGIRGRQRYHAGESEAVAADEDATPATEFHPRGL